MVLEDSGNPSIFLRGSEACQEVSETFHWVAFEALKDVSGN